MFGAVSPRAFCRRTRLPNLWIARALALVVDALTRAFVVAIEQARNRSPKREASAFSAAGPMRKAPSALLTNDRKSSCGHCRHHSGGRPQISKREALTLSRLKLIFRQSKASIGFMTQLSNSAGPLTSSSRTRALDWATPSSIETFKKKCVMSSTNITGTVYAIQKSPNSIAGWPSPALRGTSGSRHQC